MYSGPKSCAWIMDCDTIPYIWPVLMLPTYPGMAPEIFHYCIVTKTKSLYLIARIIKINRCCLAAEKIGVEAVDGNKTTSWRAKESQTIGNEARYKEDAEVLDGSKSSMMSDDNRLYESNQSIYRCHGDWWLFTGNSRKVRETETNYEKVKLVREWLGDIQDLCGACVYDLNTLAA